MSEGFRAALALARRDAGLASGNGGAWLPAGFYLVLVALVPLSLGPDPAMLSRVAPGLSFLCLALSSFLSLERLFARDQEDGVFDLLRGGPLPMEVVALIKMLSQWATSGLVLAVVTPIVMIVLGAPLSLSLLGLGVALLGSLSFALVGGIGAALCLAGRGGGLLALLVLPLYIPPVIFGSGALEAVRTGADPVSALAFLGAFGLFSLAVAPIAAGAAIRHLVS
jgi:heme exporter protein B